jgi:hypothetical protein
MAIMLHRSISELAGVDERDHRHFAAVAINIAQSYSFSATSRFRK